MVERTLTLAPDTVIRLENLARRLGLPLELALAQIAGRMDVMDRIAAMLAVAVTFSTAPLRLRPAREVSEEIAVITVQGNVVSTRLAHADDRFSEIVKGLRYRWDGGQWTRTIRKNAEPVSDRAVELGVHILVAGFLVEVRAEELQRRIAAGDYRPETRNWISQRMAGHFTGWFEIRWDREGKDYFRLVSLIRGSRCYPGAALVPAARYDEVLDFAESNGFAISDGALDLAAKAQRERAAMLLVSPVIRCPAPAPEPSMANGELSPEGILDELADEPV